MNYTLKRLVNKAALFTILIACALLSHVTDIFAQAESPKEDDFFKIMTVPVPEDVILEVGGLCLIPDGSLAVTTRRGDIFMVENPTSQHPVFHKFASGLHEVLGAVWKNDALYVAQRGELTKLVDTDKDGKADVYETIYAWPLSGNYHEYSFGPKLAPDGSFFVTLNLGFPDTWWHPKSMVPYRGWALNIKEDGTVTPWAAGFRSPCGISMIDGELWYSDNQGDWVGSGSIMQIKKGAFMGHPASLVWTKLPNSPLKLTQEQFFAKNNPRVEFDKDGKPFKPQDIVNEKYKTEFEEKKEFPDLTLPVVWLPHAILGISNSEIVKIPKGVFGPFAGQLLIGDQGQSMVDRIFLEKVNGEYQGAAWAFRSGFQSGIVRLAWLPDGSLAAGETSRGWGAAGEAAMGLQRLLWNNKMPFEMKAVRAMPDGFEIEFTKPVERKSANDIASYSIESFIYKYHGVYGSPPVSTQQCPIIGVKVSADGLRARLIVKNLRRFYIHNITINGVRDKENYYNLVHPTAYYTLNNIPVGEKLAMAGVSRLNSANKIKKATAVGAKKGTTIKGANTKLVRSVNAIPTYEEIKPLLLKNTCLSCHNANKRQVGPAYADVAKRKYSITELVQLIHNPKPEHWPDYSTPMPPMPQVPKEEARKIALWINSLAK
ncbi:c-type cytochrome [Mucilaginibacter pocheonensis]|uniref:Cytochrome c551/c552 n=1 Tax=Mucilaginibacter pocheonensis TaxID=398050 RepID=A0ABU1TH34_9SPHI|nr:c-type cytochrome [Mucilaginibacter pocheonensis]MDR6944722.1 cytochrome c551/c552 [Mucilaginibacter pocheonensis]